MRTYERRTRAGFTLIELLVIISIIAVLLTLTASAAFRLMGASATGTTRTMMTRLEERLRNLMTVEADRAREGSVPRGILAQMAGGNQDLARVIYVKLRLKARFPMSFNEALSPAPGIYDDYDAVLPATPKVLSVRPIPSYRAFLKARGITAGATPPDPHESACCLYMALKHGNEATSEEEVGVGGAVKQIDKVKANGVPKNVTAVECYVDAWLSPVIYCRTPTGSPMYPAAGTFNAPYVPGVSLIHPLGAGSGFDDPGDPKNLLNLTGARFPGQATFTSLLHPVYARTGSNARPVLSPVILSAGPDGLSGLDPLTLEYLSPSPGAKRNYPATEASNDNVLTDRNYFK
ncbi:MAG: type II secretion system protein [Gemmataceae bacterium]